MIQPAHLGLHSIGRSSPGGDGRPIARSHPHHPHPHRPPHTLDGMATMTITIPDAQLDRVVEAVCVTMGVGPATPAAARQAVIAWIRQTTLDYHSAKAQRTAVTQLPAQTDPGLT